MSWQKSLPLAAITIGALLLMYLPVEAQTSVTGHSPITSRSAPTSYTSVRIIIVITSTMIGFCIGWLLSGKAKEVREVVLFVMAIALLTLVLVLDGVLGWGITLLASFVGFSAALGWWTRVAIRTLAEVPTTFGSSRWANSKDLIDGDVLGDEGISIGQTFPDENGETDSISYKGDRHLLTVAPTRSGKGTTQIIPNLLTYEGSMLVIDPKGENALITAKRRKEMGQEVHIVDPWGIANVEGIEASTFNPLDWLDPHDPDMTENAMLLASAIVVDSNSNDPFWDEEAKALLQGLIMYVATDLDEDGSRHLGRVRELLLLNNKELKALFEKMSCSMHPIVRSTGERSLQKEEKMFSSVLASAQSHTHFLDSDRMNANMKSSSFKFEDLKTKQMTIYLVLPADRLNTFGRWLRLLVQQAITINARNIETKPEKSILFLLDEFSALGRLSMVEQAFGLMAGYGMQIWAIVQDFNQLERIYGKGWQGFVSNAGMINYFGSSDKMTAEYFSSLCGETTVWNFSSAVSTAFGANSRSSETTTNSDTRAASQRKLMYPDELMRLGKNKQIVFIENLPPLQAIKVEWFEDDELKELGVNLHPKLKDSEQALQD